MTMVREVYPSLETTGNSILGKYYEALLGL